MAQVVLLDEINEDIFVCGLCKTVFRSLQIFLSHKRIQCVNEAPVTNSIKCDIGSNINNIQPDFAISSSPPNTNLETLDKGTNNTTVSKDLSCRVCKKKYKKIKSFHSHIKTHNEKPYQCLICGRCFIQNSHLQRHIVSHKVWPDGLCVTTAKSFEADLLSYSCSYCEAILTNYSQFRDHLKSHLYLKKFKCIQQKCNSFFETMEELLDHVSVTHLTPDYVCHICYKTFVTLENIAIHHQSHAKSEKNVQRQIKHYKCQYCDAVFRKPEKLSLHMLTENHKKICIHCNKTFASDKRLRLHLQIHRKSKPYWCNICDTRFHMKKYLSTHMLKHGESQFTCTDCNHKFKRQDLLQRHMKIHQIKKTLKCPFRETLDCKREFNRSDKLKLHIKNHTKTLMIQSNLDPELSNNDVGTVEICILDTNQLVM